MYSPLPTDIWGTFFRIYTRFNGRTVASSANIQHSFVSPENFSSHFPNYLQPIARLSACLSPPTRSSRCRSRRRCLAVSATLRLCMRLCPCSCPVDPDQTQATGAPTERRPSKRSEANCALRSATIDATFECQAAHGVAVAVLKMRTEATTLRQFGPASLGELRSGSAANTQIEQNRTEPSRAEPSRAETKARTNIRFRCGHRIASKRSEGAAPSLPNSLYAPHAPSSSLPSPRRCFAPLIRIPTPPSAKSRRPTCRFPRSPRRLRARALCGALTASYARLTRGRVNENVTTRRDATGKKRSRSSSRNDGRRLDEDRVNKKRQEATDVSIARRVASRRVGSFMSTKDGQRMNPEANSKPVSTFHSRPSSASTAITNQRATLKRPPTAVYPPFRLFVPRLVWPAAQLSPPPPPSISLPDHHSVCLSAVSHAHTHSFTHSRQLRRKYGQFAFSPRLKCV
ncbi:hypothetical protein V9T40_008271 [Parthenolecanium corni]|uniref:Uncharacterized protein n=1 Tax=Parthenolecanium corni TaxID=536013 RepID=A0AAN9Y7X3_9HEMI